jgi:hypothetical protein
LCDSQRICHHPLIEFTEIFAHNTNVESKVIQNAGRQGNHARDDFGWHLVLAQAFHCHVGVFEDIVQPSYCFGDGITDYSRSYQFRVPNVRSNAVAPKLAGMCASRQLGGSLHRIILRAIVSHGSFV